MPYILENMAQEDIQQVATIERLCFSMPWPTSAYRRELKTPQTNRYVVARFIPPVIATTLKLPQPTDSNVTRLQHPELTARNGQGGGANYIQREDPPRSRWANLLPWLRNNGAMAGEEGSKASNFPLVGYAGLWLMVDEAHVTTIGVHPDHRGQGVGELLFLALADIAAEMRATKMTLEVRVSNTGAQALYRKYGLEVSGVRKRYYSDNGEDAYIMSSQPVASKQFQDRVTSLRTQLVERLQRSFYQPQPPTYPVERAILQ